VWVERCDFCQTEVCTKRGKFCQVSYKLLNKQKLCDKCFFVALDFVAGKYEVKDGSSKILVCKEKKTHKK